jgi:hypothetical protein
MTGPPPHPALRPSLALAAIRQADPCGALPRAKAKASYCVWASAVYRYAARCEAVG